MASKARQRRGKTGAGGSTVTRMCSINSTGVVFENTVPLEVCSELTLSIQTRVFGLTREWTVQGWVVECAHMRCGNSGGYQVTLLFSGLPKGLRQVLAMADGHAAHAYPVVESATMFGLN
jgi:hypothetical protein